jgi:hypothetical protein
MLDFRGLVERFFSRDIKIFFIIVLGVTVLSVLGAVIWSYASRPAKSAAEGILPIMGKPEDQTGAYSVYDLIVPDEIERYLTPDLKYHREPRESWSREEIDTYWVDPRKLGIDVLTRENRLFIKELFESVP